MEARISPPPQLQSRLIPIGSPRSISHVMLLSSSPAARLPEVQRAVRLFASSSLFPHEICLGVFALSERTRPPLGVSVDSQAGKISTRQQNLAFSRKEAEGQMPSGGGSGVGGRAVAIRFHLAHGCKLRWLEERCSRRTRHAAPAGGSFLFFSFFAD